MTQRVVQFCDDGVGNAMLPEPNDRFEGMSPGFEGFELLSIQMRCWCHEDDRAMSIIRKRHCVEWLWPRGAIQSRRGVPGARFTAVYMGRRNGQPVA